MIQVLLSGTTRAMKARMKIDINIDPIFKTISREEDLKLIHVCLV